MADPLSITASVITLIQVSVQVTVLLKQFRDEVAVVDTTLNGLLNDVESLSQVLEAMKETFDQDEIKENLQVTGHVGNHWKNLARSMKEGIATLQQLRGLLDNVNKTTSFLDGPRKQLRYKSAIDQITGFRERIQSYRSALQLSLNTVIVWNQIIFQKSTEQIPAKLQPHLDKLYSEFRAFGALLNAKIETLQGALDLKDQQELTHMRNLRETVKAAAEVASTASSTLTVEPADRGSVKYGSDFGDIFSKEANVTMKRWMDANTVYEYDDVEAAALPPESSAGDAVTEYQSDSDSDIETEMVKALFESAKKKKADGDLLAAERLFRNCLTRVSGNTSFTSLRSAAAQGIPKYQILQSLTETYVQLEFWGDATSTMRERLMIIERQVGKKDEKYFWETKTMAEILMHNQEYVEAQLQGRRALKGFKRLGENGHEGYEKCLALLVDISQIDEKLDDRDAYAALLTHHQAKIQRRSSLKRAVSIKAKSASSPDKTVSPKSHESETSKTLSSGSIATMDPTISLLSLQATSSETTNLASSISDLSLTSGPSESTASVATVTSDHSQQTEIPEEHVPRIPPLETEPYHATTEDQHYDHDNPRIIVPILNDTSVDDTSLVIDEMSRNKLSSKSVVENQPEELVLDAPESRKGIESENELSEVGSSKITESSYVPLLAQSGTLNPDRPTSSGSKEIEDVDHSSAESTEPDESNPLENKQRLSGNVTVQESSNISHNNGIPELKLITRNMDKFKHPESESCTEEASSDIVGQPKKTKWVKRPLPYIGIFHSFLFSRFVWPSEVIDVLLAFSEHVIQSKRAISVPSESLETRNARLELDTAKEVVPEYWAAPSILISPNQYISEAQEESSQLALRRTVSDSYMTRPGLTFEGAPVVTGEDGHEGEVFSTYPNREGDLLSPIAATGGSRRQRSASTSANLSGPPVFELYQSESQYHQPGLELYQPGYLPGGSSISNISDDGLIPIDSTDEGPRDFARSLVQPYIPILEDEPLCPICNSSLIGFSDASRDLHVNNCLDNPPPVQATENTTYYLPPGKETKSWRCCSDACAMTSRLLPHSTIVCPRCGHIRDILCSRFDIECATAAPLSTPLDPLGLEQRSQNLRRKLVLLGDTLCGKTSLTESWQTGKHHQVQHTPLSFTSISETFIKNIYFGGVQVELVAWDNSGLDDRNYEMLRRLSYKDVHVVLICFDIGDDDAAVDNIKHSHNPEAQLYLRDVPKILVGCKSDLRDSRNPGKLVSELQAIQLARDIDALAYFETSAVTRAGVEEVFEYAAHAALVRGVAKKKGIRRFLSRSEFKLKV